MDRSNDQEITQLTDKNSRVISPSLSEGYAG